MAPAQDNYDRLPYLKLAFPQTHPDLLAVMGRLFGMQTCPADRCRVLELGCASGTNLLQMAYYLPNASFLGVDLSQVQVAEAQETAKHLELTNVEFQHLNIMDIDESFGRFDYIVCHGVFSWVPPEVQDRILTIARENLADNGIAYLSYNVYPGWYSLRSIRELMMFHGGHFEDPDQRLRQAKSILKLCADGASKREDHYSKFFNERLEMVLDKPDNYVAHEFMEDENRPMYFHEFAKVAAEHDLQYVGDVPLTRMAICNVPPGWEVVPRETREEVIALEQYLDFLSNRQFRQSLVCRAEVELQRNPTSQTMQGFSFASQLQKKVLPDGQIRFERGPRHLTTTDVVTIGVMEEVSKCWPDPVTFSELFESACPSAANQDQARRDLCEFLLQAIKHELIDLTLQNVPKLSDDKPEFPRVNQWVMSQIKDNIPIFDFFSRSVNVPEMSREIIRLMDGRHTGSIFTELMQRARSGAINFHEDGKKVTDDARIRQLMQQEINTTLSGVTKHRLLCN